MARTSDQTSDFIETSRLTIENSRSIVRRFDRNQLMIEAWIERAVSLTIAFGIWSHQGDDKTLREKDDGSLSIRSTEKRRACSSREANQRWHADWKSASVGRHAAPTCCSRSDSFPFRGLRVSSLRRHRETRPRFGEPGINQPNRRTFECPTSD